MCGVAWIARPGSEPSHDVVDRALSVLSRMTHRGGAGGDAKTGDGCGIMLDLDPTFCRHIAEEEGFELPPEFAVGMVFLPSRAAKERVERSAAQAGFVIVGWRRVPVRPQVLGPIARTSQPEIMQFFVRVSGDDAEQRLFLWRRRLERAESDIYVCSLSTRTIVYKGLLTPEQLAQFYLDLSHPGLRSRVALVHQRFSTNTQPSWHRAHPYRLLAHNGEINTIRGNPQSFEMREPALSDVWQASRPLIDTRGSDSAQLDNAVEVLLHLGWSLPEALVMVLPPVTDEHTEASRVARLNALSSRMEAWDGPAAVLAYDGTRLVARLDRNGLRPLRWWHTQDGWSLVASELGADRGECGVMTSSGRVGPGQSITLDLTSGTFDVLDQEWLRRELQTPLAVHLTPSTRAAPAQPSDAELARFGMTNELRERVLVSMAERGEEPIGSMGNDTPVPPFSRQDVRFFDCFRQQFAQVTNPPIDAIREERVMNLRVWLGPVASLQPSVADAHVRLQHPQPFISPAELEGLREQTGLKVATVYATLGDETLQRALVTICEQAEQAVRHGAQILVLSDDSATRLPMPSALALAAVRTHLRRKDCLGRVSLVVDAGDVVSTHDASVLVGLGAHLVAPRLAFTWLAHVHGEVAADRYLHALEKGLKKVMSKMGVSVVSAYRGAGLFETLGLSTDVRRHFPETPHRLDGIDLLAVETTMRRRGGATELPLGGTLQWRREGEMHAWSPETIGWLQHAARSGRMDIYDKFAKAADALAEQGTLRGRLRFAERTPIALGDVEPAAAIVTRFKTGAMSLGSISPEAHETLALAMNALGGRSNTGEGGEDPARFGTQKRSAIKQVASGRFGVTIDYLADADELQIKMAQGAKPGEGGQLPGHKVNALIARLRCSTEGVTLISPPPHHDIYSIEDLAQLIYDLKASNPRARISVKLVAESGVGTIAAGVVKAGADVVVISGDSGGTGASPLSSIRHAGIPWELGLADAQQALLANRLRGRVRLETDGLLRTGRDVIVAALLGADEFAFATSALVAAGCVLMRVCHLNTCPVGIATQDEALRERFTGEPEHVINFMRFIAEDVRRHLAALGVRSLQELIGRTELLRGDGELLRLLYRPDESQERKPQAKPVTLIDDAVVAALRQGVHELSADIDTSHRSLGARLSSHRATDPTLRQPFTLRCTGVAGQSFGLFLGKDVTLSLQGHANDYVGKGLSGGTLIVQPEHRLEQDTLIGNVAFFGATSGEGFIAGAAGERFAVRNSGASLVVESVGEHGCEYMTRGTVVVLGEIGYNFATGMSGGVAFVAPHGELAQRVHPGSAVIEPVGDEDLEPLRALVQRHFELTQSRRAWAALQSDHLRHFVRIVPRDRADKKAVERPSLSVGVSAKEAVAHG